MNDSFNDFQRRVARIAQTQGRRAPDSFIIRPDGLMVPKVRSRLRFYFPFRAILAGAFVIVAVKAVMIAYLTLPGYETRLASLLTGTTYEALASRVLAPDPVSVWAAERLTDAMFTVGMR